MSGLLKGKVHLILPVTKDRLSSFLKTQNDINFGFAKTSVKPQYTCWIIFISDLALSYTDKLLVFRWVLIVLLLKLTSFLFCYERDFMTSLSDVKQAEIIEAFKSISSYLDDLLNIDNPYFEGMGNRIYLPELQLNKANTSDTEAPFLDLYSSISNGFFHLKFMISAMTLILI